MQMTPLCAPLDRQVPGEEKSLKQKASVMMPYTTNEVKPKGWLLRQLQIQANGLSGHLDEFWLDIKESKWIGGDREAWERVPYWLDGFVPLAWLLDDEHLKQRAKRYIDGILERQCEDGWICPCEKKERAAYDVWAALLICKALMVYYDCSRDERIPDAVARALRQLNLHLEHHSLFNWGAARWYEGLIPLYRLMRIRGREDWMEELIVKLSVQGTHYPTLYKNWYYKQPKNRWDLLTHVVNQAMMLKSDALLACAQGRDPDAFAEHAWRLLMKHHGQAYGHFSGDECLSGTEPTQGTELCGVVEAMYSYEVLSALTMAPKWGDRLEAAAVNALPATLSPDMCSHQYVQMANQIECSVQPQEHIVYRTISADSNLFGLEPSFGCCTANMHQGYPKLALSVFFEDSEGIVAWMPYPAELKTEREGKPVTVRIVTDYPFRDTVVYEVENPGGAEFRLSVRVPGSADGATANGKAVPVGTMLDIPIAGDCRNRRVELRLQASIRTEQRPSGMFVMRRGPLLYALRIREKWTEIDYERKKTDTGTPRVYPFCDYRVEAESPWNYALVKGGRMTYEEREPGAYPFSPDGAPCAIHAEMYEIPWTKEYGRCRNRPDSTRHDAKRHVVEWIPYGCTNLRMTELPML